MYFLTEYAKEHNGNVSLVSSLVKKFIDGKPPSNLISPEGECHECYSSKKDQRELAAVAHTIFERERELRGISLNSERGLATRNPSSRIFYVPRGLPDAQRRTYIYKRYLQKHALLYAYYGLGNCSHRASYSAIYLAKYFEGTSVKVTLFSFVARDQFVVLLTDKGQTLVYDPFTNPEKLYEPEYYKNEILRKCFEKKPKEQRGVKVNLTVDAGQYEELLVTLLDYHYDDKVDFGKTDDLLKDPDFLSALSDVKNDKKELIKKALSLLCTTRKEPPFFTDNVAIEKSDETISSASLLGIADAALFAVKNGLPIEDWLTEEQLKSAQKFGMNFK